MFSSLSVTAKISLISNICNDFADFIKFSYASIPDEKEYIIDLKEDYKIKQAARMGAYTEFKKESLVKTTSLIKLAFDTRKVDQEHERNPRENLQYWHRSAAFIDQEDQVKLKIFAKLFNVVDSLKSRLGTDPDWFNSYCRQLYDHLVRILRIKEGDLDIFKPSLAYLEQLLYARYRLSLENIENMSEKQLEESILSKDEILIGRASYLSDIRKNSDNNIGMVKNNIPSTQEAIVNAIFGSDRMVRDGERKVERTITIKICDAVVE